MIIKTIINICQLDKPIFGNIIGKKYAITEVIKAEPILPSQVFLGETLSNNLCFPIKLPTQYANVSDNQITMNIDNNKYFPFWNKTGKT